MHFTFPLSWRESLRPSGAHYFGKHLTLIFTFPFIKVPIALVSAGLHVAFTFDFRAGSTTVTTVITDLRGEDMHGWIRCTGRRSTKWAHFEHRALIYSSPNRIPSPGIQECAKLFGWTMFSEQCLVNIVCWTHCFKHFKHCFGSKKFVKFRHCLILKGVISRKRRKFGELSPL